MCPLQPSIGALLTLAIIRERPDLAVTLLLDAAQRLLTQATAAQTARDALLVRVATAGSTGPSSTEPRNRNLDADQIAAALGQTRRWVFRNSTKLPFVHRISRKSLVASETDLLKWRAMQKA